MAQHQNIDFGSGPGGDDGDTVHAAFTKVHANTQGLHSPTPRVVTASFNITADDVAGVIVVDSAAPVIGTVQAGIVTGAGRIAVIQKGAGKVTLLGANGVTIGNPDGLYATKGANATAVLTHAGGNLWSLEGDLAAGFTLPTAPLEVTAQLQEGVANNTLVGSITVGGGGATSITVLSGNAAGRFTVTLASPTQVQIRTAATIEYNDAAAYTLQIQISNPAGSVTSNFNINVQEVPAPSLIGADFTAVETAQIGTTIGTIQNIGGAATSWTITAGNASGDFEIIGGQIRVKQALDFSVTPSYTLTITATGVGGTSQPVISNISVVEIGGGAITTLQSFDIDHNGMAGAVASIVVTFPDGKVPAGSVIGVRRRDSGAFLRSQFEPRTFWDSGDVLSAELSVELPAAADGTIIPCMLQRGETHPTPGNAINLGTALSGRSCSVVVTPLAGGSPWTLNVVSAQARGAAWNAGPLKASKRVIEDVPATALGGACQSMRCVVDLTLTADGVLRADVQMRNDKFFGGTVATASYTVRVTQDGVVGTLYTLNAHGSRAWFTREYATTAGSPGAAAPRRVVVRMPVRHYSDAGIFPPYDGSNGLSPTALPSKTQSWDTPFDNRLMRYDFGGTGGSLEIGFIPRHAIGFWLSWRRDAFDIAIDQGETYHGVPWHLWDAANGEWVNSIRRPDYVQQTYPPTATPYAYDSAHSGNPQTPAYILSCRRSMLDALLGQAYHNAVFTPRNTQYAGVFANTDVGAAGEAARRAQLLANGEGATIYRAQQLRGSAWFTRQMVLAAALAPSSEQAFGDSIKVYARAQFAWLLSRRSDWQTWCGQLYGWYAEKEYGNPDVGHYPPWQHNFATLVAYVAARTGITEAKDFLRWQNNYHVEQYHQGNVIPRADSILYLRWLATGFKTGFKTTWAQVYADHFSNPATDFRLSNGFDPVTAWAGTMRAGGGYYAAYGLAELVCLYELFKDENELTGKIAEAIDYIARADNAATATLTVEGARLLLHCQFWHGRDPNAVILPTGRTRAPVAPTIPTQTIRVPESAEVDKRVGAVNFEGNIFHTNWEIVGGSSVFSIDSAGVLWLEQPLNFDVTSSYALTIRVTNPNGTATGSVTVQVLSQAPTLQNGVTATRPENYGVGSTVATVAVGGAPSTLTITAGDPTNLFDVSNSGVITVASPWTGQANTVKTIEITATNSYGTVTTTVQVTITPPVFAPGIDQGQVFVVSENAAIDSVIGTVVASSGSPVVTWRIISGNTGGRVSINPSTGQLRVAAPFTGLASGFMSLEVEAENTAGFDRRTVAINLAEAQTVFNTPTEWFALYSLGRRLRTAYSGPIVRLRRGWDNAEQDFGLTGGGALDESAITTWLGAAPVGQRDSYVVTWYDQGLRGQHLTQATQTRQPRFTTTAGTFYTPAGGGSSKPVMDIDGGRCLVRSGFITDASPLMGAVIALHTPQGSYAPHVVTLDTPGGAGAYGSGNSTVALISLGPGANTVETYRGRADFSGTVSQTHATTFGANTPQTLAAAFTGTTTLKQWVQATRNDWTVASVAALADPGELRLGVMVPGNGIGAFSGKVYELVVFKTTSAPNTDVPSIEVDIRRAWGFGPPVETALEISPNPQSLPAVSANATNGVIVGTVQTAPGGSPATWSITAGNTGGRFAVSNSGVITVAASLVAGNYALTVQTVNGGGTRTGTVNIEVSAAVIGPTLDTPLVFNVTEPVEPTATIGDITFTGGTPSTWTKQSGDAGGHLAISQSGRLSAAKRLIAADTPSIAVVIRGENSGGGTNSNVTVNVAAVATSYGTSGTNFLGTYALRRVRTSYSGPLVKLRRVADNVEQDFFAVDVGGGLWMLDVAAVTTFANGGRVTVRRLYDQSVRAQHLDQVVGTLQPEITNASGVVHVMPGTGGRPMMNFTGGGMGLYNLAFETGASTSFGAILQTMRTNTSTGGANLRVVSLSATVNGEDGSSGGFRLSSVDAGAYYLEKNFNGAYFNSGKPANVAQVVSARFQAADNPRLLLHYNGEAQAHGNPAAEAALNVPAALRIGCRNEVDTTLGFVGGIGEIVLVAVNPDADRQAIESSIRAFVGF